MGDDTPLAVLSADIDHFTIFLDKTLVKLQIPQLTLWKIKL